MKTVYPEIDDEIQLNYNCYGFKKGSRFIVLGYDQKNPDLLLLNVDLKINKYGINSFYKIIGAKF